MDRNTHKEKPADHTKDSKISAQFDECEWRPKLWQQRIYHSVSILCIFLSLWCVLALTPPFSGCLSGVMDFLRRCEIIRWLSDLSVAAGTFFKNGSLDAVVRLIGLTMIAWLITAADRKILGVPIVRLISWAYPRTISYYTHCFIPLVLLGVYINGTDFPEAAFYATVGTLLLYAHFMHICVVMLLSPDVRECIVYSFYMDRLRNPPTRSTTRSIPLFQRRTSSSKQIDPTYLPSAILHRVVECARSLMEDEHHMNSEPTFKIWVEAMKRISGGFELKAGRLKGLVSGETNDILENELKGMLLSQEAWSVLLRDPMSHAKRQQAVRRLLVRLHTQEGDGGDPSLQAFILGGLALALCGLFPADDGLKCLMDICGPLKPLEGEESSGFSPTDQISYELTGFQQRTLLWTYGYCMLLMDKLGSVDQKKAWQNYQTVFKPLEQEVVLPSSFDIGIADGYIDENTIAAAHGRAFGSFEEMLGKPAKSDTLWAWLEFLFWYAEWAFLQAKHYTYSELESHLSDEDVDSLEYLHRANRIRHLVRYITSPYTVSAG